MINFRASSIAEIMSDGKGADGLSVSAKTFLNGMAKEFVYGFCETIDTKYFKKGIQCEDAGIDLLNDVLFENYTKNTERKTNEWITGEADIVVPSKKIVDVKAAWSLATFPATSDEVSAIAKKSGYDFQGAAYMWLWDIDEFEIAYYMVTTPEDLRKYEQPEIHEVDHIDPALRISLCQFKRDKAIEEKMKSKVIAARNYLENYAAQIRIDHKHEEIRKAA